MAGYNQFDTRLETLVVETRTIWGEDVGTPSSEERRGIAMELHRAPELASSLLYERTHTGFIREITVTPADLERLHRQLHSQSSEVRTDVP
ncbi:MAG TPA: hypothetical protein VNQ76_13380 [Planctomicrobium sp.]|nr:hypothetical protein [Planctomicrobium sp.]